MRRGYTDTARNRDQREDNEASDYSRDDELPQPARYRSSSRSRHDTSPPPRRSSFTNKERPSGIPRPGSHVPSRLPSALKTPRSRSYSSSSSADSQNTNDDIIPPVPHISVERGRSGSAKPSNQELAPRSENVLASQAGLSRRPTSVSRSRSRSYSRSGTTIPEPHPPPLPGSNSDGDDSLELHLGQESERTPNPKQSSWAKDRRRFADPTTSTRSTSEASGYDPPPTPVIPGRKASLKTTANYRSSAVPGTNAPLVPNRIPSATKSAWVPTEERRSSDYDESSQASSRSGSAGSGHVRHDNLSNEASQRGTPRPRGTNEPARVDPIKSSQIGTENAHAPPTTPSWSRSNRYTSTHSKTRPTDADDQAETEPVRISSMMDAPLPTPPLPQFDAAVRSRTPQIGQATVSSPVETLLMGSAPASATPNSRSMSASTPKSKSMSSSVRSARESSVYASTTPNARRLSESSPSKESHNPVAGDQEAPPTIFQRLVRRASLSTGKSPKSGSTPKSPKAVSTPKNQMVVEHNADESPFGLELETPRPGAAHSSSDVRSDQSERNKSRQSNVYLPNATASEPKNPRLKVVEGESAKLGSPFMGDGSPRFGIDERFRSPKKRTKSGLRNGTFDESNGDRSQELYDYYAASEVENTGDYLTEAFPIATVLSSPDNSKGEKTPTGRSKKLSQYQSTARVRAGASVTNDSETTSSVSETSISRHLRTPARSRTPSSVAPPTITRTSARASTGSSNRSQFSDSSDEREAPAVNHSTSRAHPRNRGECDKKSPEAPVLRRPRSTVRFAIHHEQEEFDRNIDQDSCQPSNALGTQLKDIVQKPFQDGSDTSDHRTNPESDARSTSLMAKRPSQLPVPRQRKINSALFRALEQPYESSSSIVASVDSSSGLTQTSSDGGTHSDYVSTGDSVEGLHAVSSNLSSLNGESVGDIRWSTGEERNQGFDQTIRNMLENVDRSKTTNGGNQCSAIDELNYEIEEESALSGGSGTSDTHRASSHWSSDRNKLRRISVQDKRKAIHESSRASFEGVTLATNDPMEVRRHQIVWDFCQREANFVETLQALVQLFVQPLRAENQREWIAGLAPDIMRLFDWLDDIANLHGQLLVALESSQQDRSSISGFCETVKGFIPLMELYQPYVVRVDEVRNMITSMVLDSESDFGEFVRIQSEQLLGEENLEDMLGLPLLRLRGYVTTFQELLQVTPRAHVDYFVTFSLLHSVHATICVLEEVKVREEEYNMVKNLLNQVRGLPSVPKLATRDRRLLAQGLLTQILVDPNEEVRASRPILSRQPGGLDVAATRVRSGSESTATYSTTGSMTSSCRPMSSSTVSLGDSATYNSMRPNPSATSSITTPFGSHHAESKFIPRTNVASPRRSVSQGPQHFRIDPRGETTLYALVFTDCLVLARPTKDIFDSYRSPRKPRQKQPDKLEAIGIFWLLSVADCTSHCGYDRVLSLDIISVGDHTPDDMQSPVLVAVPYLNKGSQDTQQAYQEWSQSLHRCWLNTLRSLGFASQLKAPILSPRGQFLSVSSTMDAPTSDTRFPKSPSQQLEHEIDRKRAKLPPMENAEEEREERAFWSERFRAISQEMQRTYEGLGLPTAITFPEPEAAGATNNNRFRSSNTYI